MTGDVLDRDGDANDSNKELADAHASSADEEETATTETLNTPHARKRHHHVDHVGDNSNNEGVRDARVLEESSAVVKDEVDTSELEWRVSRM